MASRRRIRYVVSAVLVTALAGCDGVDRQGPVAGSDAIVHLSRDSVDLILDVSEQFTVTRTDLDGNPAPARLRWRSGDTHIAIVDSGGNATAVGLGRTWIEVSDNHNTDTAIVNTYLRFASVNAGDQVTCGLATGGQAACWGRNTFGTLGDGQHLDRSDPDLVSGGHRFNQLSVAAASACALALDLYCWGYNGVGQLGDGTISERPAPVIVADTLDLSNVTLGAGTTTCAFEQPTGVLPSGPRRARGTTPVMLCWGWNGFGQMLDGGGVNPHRPKVVDTGKSLVSLAPGGHHICGLDPAGAAWCWGRNDDGQLGDSTFTPGLSPVAVVGGNAYDMLASGISHSCARAANHQVWCWGSDAFGQLGTGSGTSSVPQLAAGGMTFDTVVATANHTCALHGGTAWCWGDNAANQLGRASGNQPAPVAGNLTFTSISAGSDHTCAIASDGLAYCWGGNKHGQLGAATAPDGFSPVRVATQR